MAVFKPELTPRQIEIVQTICRLHWEYGRVPTIRECCAALGMPSPTGLVWHARSLERKGWIARKKDNKSRSWYCFLRKPPGWTLLPGGGICPDDQVQDLIAQLRQVTEIIELEKKGEAKNAAT